MSLLVRAVGWVRLYSGHDDRYAGRLGCGCYSVRGADRRARRARQVCARTGHRRDPARLRLNVVSTEHASHLSNPPCLLTLNWEADSASVLSGTGIRRMHNEHKLHCKLASQAASNLLDAGSTPYPWEVPDSNAMSETSARRFILSCLSRSPEDRPTAAALRDAIDAGSG